MVLYLNDLTKQMSDVNGQLQVSIREKSQQADEQMVLYLNDLTKQMSDVNGQLHVSIRDTSMIWQNRCPTSMDSYRSVLEIPQWSDKTDVRHQIQWTLKVSKNHVKLNLSSFDDLKLPYDNVYAPE